MSWFIITCRIAGADEDSVHIIESDDAAIAVEIAEAREVEDVFGVKGEESYTERGEDDDFFLNYIIRCDTEPTILQEPPNGGAARPLTDR